MTRAKSASLRLFTALLCSAIAAGAALFATTPPASAAGTIEVSVVQHGNQATITWISPSSPAEGWRVGRDGKDSGGYGAWSSTISPEYRSWTFNYLIRGDTYNLSIASSIGSGSVRMIAGATVPSATPTIAPTPTTPATSPTSAAPPGSQQTAGFDRPAAVGRSGWLSGVATQEKGNTDPAKYFGDWRGAPVEIGQTWPHTPDVWGINPSVANSWSGFTGPMSLSFSPGPDWNGLRGWRSYAAINRGEMDAWWRAAARNTKRFRSGMGTTYVSPFYEYNGDWMAWSVTRNSRGYADFTGAWERVSRIWNEEFPEVRLVLPAACARDVPGAMMPDPSSYDLVGCTIYNAWPWQSDGRQAMRLLETGRRRAQSVGKPFAITEWANSASRGTAGGGGDAPEFISTLRGWMEDHAGTGSGQLVFEAFFNIDGYALDHILLRLVGGDSGTQSRTAAKYRELWSS